MNSTHRTERRDASPQITGRTRPGVAGIARPIYGDQAVSAVVRDYTHAWTSGANMRGKIIVFPPFKKKKRNGKI